MPVQARRRQRREGSSVIGLCQGLRLLGRNMLFVKLTACVMQTGIVMEGMYELMGQYLQLKLGYTIQDQVVLVDYTIQDRVCSFLQGS